MAKRMIAREGPIENDSSLKYILPELQRLHGNVLEIGAGAGSLLQCLPKGVHYTALEPNQYLHPAIVAAAQKQGISVGALTPASAERLPFADGSFDAVISVRTLCAMRDLSKVLSEIKRVLRTGGVFIFAEHVAAPRGSWRRVLQIVARPLWLYRVGCSPAVEIGPAIERAGFSSVQITPFSVGGRRNIVVRLRIFGIARK